MPEGVEVLISSEMIKPLVINKTITKLQIGPTSRYTRQPLKGFTQFKKLIQQNNCVIKDIKTYGKFMYWLFTNDWYMFSTFGMSGQWSPSATHHLCLQLELIDENQTQTTICFNDPRHFGTIQFTNNSQELSKKLDSLGWDPLSQANNEQYINFVINSCRKKHKPIGQLLMDQSLFAGVGNYIRAEALYLSKISPWRLGSSLSKEELFQLCQDIIKVMQDSYQHQGATIRTYKDAFGAEGKHANFFKVYGKSHDEMGNLVISELTPEGRTIHWCPAVQF